MFAECVRKILMPLTKLDHRTLIIVSLPRAVRKAFAGAHEPLGTLDDNHTIISDFHIGENIIASRGIEVLTFAKEESDSLAFKR